MRVKIYSTVGMMKIGRIALSILVISSLASCAHRTEPKIHQETKSNQEAKNTPESKSGQESKSRAEQKSNPERKSNPDSYRIPELAELVGTYKNTGPYEYYLSNVIWGNAFPTMDAEGHPAHAAVELIDITSTNNSLTAKAIQNGCVISVKTYIIGRDLDIDNGQVVIHRNLRSSPGAPEDVPANPSYEKIILGIDAGRQDQSASGLARLFVLFAASENHDVQFERMAGKSKGFHACENR